MLLLLEEELRRLHESECRCAARRARPGRDRVFGVATGTSADDRLTFAAPPATGARALRRDAARRLDESRVAACTGELARAGVEFTTVEAVVASL